MTSSAHTSSHTSSSTLRRTLRRLRFVAHVDLHPTRYVPCPAHTAALRRGIPSPSSGGWRSPVTASFGVGVGIGIGVDFCRSVFARFLANCIPSLAEFLVARRHSDLFFDSDSDTDPDPDCIRFLCLSLSCQRSGCGVRRPRSGRRIPTTLLFAGLPHSGWGFIRDTHSIDSIEHSCIGEKNLGRKHASKRLVDGFR